MKRNLDTPILQLDGSEFSDKPTLKTVAFLCVTTPSRIDESATTEKKLELYRLAQKVHVGGVVDFTAEELAALKDRIGRVMTHVVVVGQALALLDADYEATA